MTFVSYAQNLEDVMLWRALRNFGPGFYIDVGACDPVSDSVTKAFYDMGWRGINVEPMKESFERIQGARPRDINLNLAIDEEKGMKTFFCIDGGGGLSTSIQEFADKYVAEGRRVEKLEVQTNTLSDICKAFVNQEINFLKIDVEGSEALVLEGADFKNYRPWVILVESTDPNTTNPSFSTWEPILLRSEYTFVYFDGLNRFYLANEKLDLFRTYFSSPPNWFDDYEKYKNIALVAECNLLKNTIDEISALSFPSFANDEEIVDRIGNLISNHSFITQKLSEQELKIDKYETSMSNLSDVSSIVKTKLAENSTELERYKKNNSKLNLELDACHQELYESSKYIGFLSKERNNANITIQSLQRKSWLVTRPIRSIAGYFKKLGIWK